MSSRGSPAAVTKNARAPFADAARAASPDSIFHLYELAPGFLFALVVTVIVSLLTEKPSQEMLDEFDEVSGHIPMDRYLSRVRDSLGDVLADDKVTVEEANRIRGLLDEMPTAKD